MLLVAGVVGAAAVCCCCWRCTSLLLAVNVDGACLLFAVGAVGDELCRYRCVFVLMLLFTVVGVGAACWGGSSCLLLLVVVLSVVVPGDR